jgi:hypothetical protein
MTALTIIGSRYFAVVGHTPALASILRLVANSELRSALHRSLRGG